MTGVSDPPLRRDHDVASAAVVVALELPADRPFAAVCRLVAAGVAGRHDVTVDRIDELQLALDTALRQPPAGDVVSLRITPTQQDLRVELGPLAVEALEREALERVLSTLVAGAEASDAGRHTWIDMRIPLPEADRG